MLKLPLGTIIYTRRGHEYTVTKNGTKYITVSNQQGHEYKCVWEENKLVSKSSDTTTTTFYTKVEFEKRGELLKVEKTIDNIKKDFNHFYKIESELGTLKSLLQDALEKINQYENIREEGE